MPVDETKERLKAIEMAVGQIEKQFGKGAIMRMGENLDMQIAAIPRRRLPAIYVGDIVQRQVRAQRLKHDALRLERQHPPARPHPLCQKHRVRPDTTPAIR